MQSGDTVYIEFGIYVWCLDKEVGFFKLLECDKRYARASFSNVQTIGIDRAAKLHTIDEY